MKRTGGSCEVQGRFWPQRQMLPKSAKRKLGGLHIRWAMASTPPQHFLIKILLKATNYMKYSFELTKETGNVKIMKGSALVCTLMPRSDPIEIYFEPNRHPEKDRVYDWITLNSGALGLIEIPSYVQEHLMKLESSYVNLRTRRQRILPEE
jgi:hypothetical protein